jgi:hypothetical protein
MQNTVTERAPMHLWIVGGLATLWNCIGPIDYLMTRTHNDGWIKASMPGVDPQSVYAYVESFPIWASFGWGLGVWMGLLGSVLLLLRKRWAVPVLGLSLVGAILGIGYQLMNPANWPGLDQGAAKVMPYVIIAVALALFLYARAMASKGVLR